MSTLSLGGRHLDVSQQAQKSSISAEFRDLPVNCDAAALLGDVRRTSAFDVRSKSDNGPKSDVAACLKSAIDRDRGEPCSSAPPPPPCVRVRTRRFEKLR